ncbi:MAG: prolipoprotein diacylglyceryl transferase [Chroococcidiopsidaceae cyanobacterium CP_BM_ER_R8_30]|nr:prolipoprotein diacylglyceryl transferase [Chroococcidiopsidaceae cyanobacterium CP_BM_ER_R8_30]
MLYYPEINPIALKIGPFTVHWYGIMYLIGFVGGWGVLWLRIRKPCWNWTSEQLSDLLFYVVLGVVLGGRIGYVLFYNLPFYVTHPIQIFEMWDGGMSFHGGLLGVLLAMWLYSRRHNRGFFEVVDFIAPAVPIGLGTGRIGNFINGELWGKVSNLPWAMQLPCHETRFWRYCDGAVTGYSQPRQPSQLYEAFLEGLVMFVVLWWFSAKPRPRMAVSGLFALLYGVFRFGVEFVRLPDPQLGYLAFGWLTMGQVLSLPLILGGILLLKISYSSKFKRRQELPIRASDRRL